MRHVSVLAPQTDMTVRAKLDAAIARYRRTFADAPRYCLLSPTDAAALRRSVPKHGPLPVELIPRRYCQRHVFHVAGGRNG